MVGVSSRESLPNTLCRIRLATFGMVPELASHTESRELSKIETTINDIKNETPLNSTFQSPPQIAVKSIDPLVLHNKNPNVSIVPIAILSHTDIASPQLPK